MRLAAEALSQSECHERVAVDRRLLASVHAGDRRVVQGGREAMQPVAVRRNRILRQEDDQVAFGPTHGAVPGCRSRRLTDLHEPSEGKLTDDMAGAVRRPAVRADYLERLPPLAHDPVKDRSERPAGVQRRNDDRDGRRGFAHGRFNAGSSPFRPGQMGS